MTGRSLTWSSAIALGVATTCIAPRAPADSASAEALFRDGRRLMEAGKLDEACPKLAESYESDPATGTLLALGLCYERAGKTATAWATYSDAADRAKREGRQDRESAARERIAALEPKLAKLTIVVSDEARATGGLVIERDGTKVGSAAWETPVPVDRGAHEVTASAPGHRPWTKSVELSRDGETQTVRIPELEAETAPSGTPREGTKPRPDGSPLKTWGLVTAGVGVVALGVGTYFGLRAKKLNSDSMSDCDGNACGPEGKADRLDAKSAGNTATIAFIAGGVLVGTGVTLFVLGSSKGAQGEHASTRFSVSVRGSAAVVSGRF